MAERDPYVRHRTGGPGARLAALAGVLMAAAVLAALAFGFTRTVGGGEEEAAPPPPPPTETAPPKPVLRIVFPEGFTRAEMADRIGEVNRIAERRRDITPSLRPRQYLRASGSAALLPEPFKGAKAPHLEGFLFPATYNFDPDTTSRALVGMQVDAFSRAWEGIDLRRARSRNLSPYDVLIIASMVEKEVQVPRERALVAAVIYNRLEVGLPLGIDATIRYGLGVPATESLRESHLADPNPYNTRIHTGLPPTPIANPGLAAIEAAARPADVDYLYFVRKADCRTHFFTASEDEFYERLAGPRC